MLNPQHLPSDPKLQHPSIFDRVLQTKWFDFLKLELSSITSVTLSKLYELYNKFYQIHGGEVKLYLREQYRMGINGPKKGQEFLGLGGFTPMKIFPIDPDGKKSPGKNLRCPDGSYFYSVELVGQSNVWLSPDDVLSEGRELYARYSGKHDLEAGLLASGPMLTRLKGLVACGHTGWTRQSKGKTRVPDNIKDWFKRARNSETPLPDFSRVYDVELGVVKKNS